MFNHFGDGLQGIIQPHSIKEVPLHITAECLEEVSTMAFFMIFGSSDAPLVGYRNLSASKLSTSFNMQTAIVRSYFYHGVKVIQCNVLI